MKQTTLGTSHFKHFLSSLLILISIFYLGLYLWTALHRITYPFELEWMEGAMVDECRQILGGNPLYRAPELEYVPFVYPPGYFVVSALAMRLFGVGFFAPRLVSLIASLGSMLLLCGIVKRETGSYTAGIISAGLFAASYEATGAWMDIARVDSLFIFWVVLGVFTATRWSGRTGSAIMTALIFSGAFFTKQVALAPALAVGLYYLIKERKQFIIYVTTLAVLVVGGTLWLNHHYGGWYIYYVFLLSSRHALQLSQIREFFLRDILRVLPIIFGLSVYAGIVIINNCRSLKKATPGLLYLLLGASLFAVSFIGRGNINSYINTLLPMSLALALLSGWAWGNTLPRKIEIPRKPFTIPHSLFPTMISLLIVVQFMALFYSPFRYIPTTKDRRAGERLIALMENSEGPILLPFHGYLPQLAGKEPSAHWTAVLDLLLAMKEEDDDPARVWLDQLIAALEEGRYEKIILDREDWFPDLLKLRYRKAGEIFSGSRIFFPVTGYPWRPQYRYNRIFPEEKF